MKIHEIVTVTSWISVVLILWGMVSKVLASSFVTWFAFVFFLLSAILVGAANRRM